MGGSQTSTTNTVDPKLMALYQQNYNTAQGVANRPYQPYTGEGVAPLNAAQQQAEGILGSVATNPAYGAALSGAENAASGILGNLQNPQTLANANLSAYENPYETGVINSTMAQLNQQQQQALMANQQQATQEGAFGGNRLGVQNALTSQLYNQDDAQTLAQLNAQNYTQAQQAAEYDLNLGLQNNALGLTAANDLANLGMDQFNLGAGQGSLLDQVGQE